MIRREKLADTRCNINGEFTMCIDSGEADFCVGRNSASNLRGGDFSLRWRQRRAQEVRQKGSYMSASKSFSRIAMGLVSASFLAAGVTSASAQETTLGRGDSVVTGFSGIRPSDQPIPPGDDPLDHFFIDLEGPSAQILSMSGLGGRPTGQLVSPAAKRQIKASEVGQVFAITLDDGLGNKIPNIYLGATSAYGIHLVKPDASGTPKRIKTGAPGAQFMAGQFGPTPAGNPGTIWRIDGASGEVSAFTTLPGNSGPGIGDVVFDKRSRSIYASDLDQGLIQRVGADGTVIDSFDHGVAGRPAKGLPAVADDGNVMNINSPAFNSVDPNTWGFTQKDRMVHGMAIHNGRLYYAVTGGLQIWSVGLGDDGSFSGDPRWELDVKSLPGTGSITDIAFDKQGRMILAQRGNQRGSYDFSVFAEAGKSAVVRYSYEQPDDPNTESVWQADGEQYAIGMPAPHNYSNGGIALGYAHDKFGSPISGTCSTMLWSTGSRLRSSEKPDEIDAGDATKADVHGLQGNDLSLVRPQNVPPSQSYFADYDGLFGDAEKAGHLGDVEIWQPCDSVDFGAADSPLPPGYFPPGAPPELPPEFPPPVYDYNTNLELTKRASPQMCAPWGAGYFCQYQVRVRNTGPDNYTGQILVDDKLPALPAGAIIGTTGLWNCFSTGASSFKCHRPFAFLAPGTSLSFNTVVWVPNTYQPCHLQNTAQIEWAPGGTRWNTDPTDDFDDATALIPAAHCPPPPGPTNLSLEKNAEPRQCVENGNGFRCQYSVIVTNQGPGIYNGPVHVRDTPLAGTNPLFSWACVAAGGSYDCSNPPVNLWPGQQLFLWTWLDVPYDVARANNCQIPNDARITLALGGTFQNINPGDDADSAIATIPATFCPQVLKSISPPPAKSCPPGYRLKNGSCEPKTRRCPSGTTGKYPNCKTRIVDPPKQCPPGTYGRYPRCKEIVEPPKTYCPPGTHGRYPRCKPNVCKYPLVGKWPNCRKPVVEVCPTGTHGHYPRCKPNVCKYPLVGKWPNCRKPVVEVCPYGTYGKYPRCKPRVCRGHGRVGKWPNCYVPGKVCPSGTHGKYPRCKRNVCKRPLIGKWPNCRRPPVKKVCPSGTYGKYPRCRPKVCARGTTGKWPNCRKIIKRCPRGTVGRFPNCKRITHGNSGRGPTQIAPRANNPNRTVR